jgi:hypothetical protein
VEFIYFGISYDNPCSPLSFSLLPTPGSPLQAHVLVSSMAALKEFDGKQPCMGNIYIIMRALRHYVATLHNAPFNMPSHLVEPLEVALRNREAMVASDLYYTGTLLNPNLIKYMELRDDQHAMARLMRVFQRLSDTTEEFQAVKA